MSLKKIIYFGLFTAVTCVVTMILVIPIAQGYINSSDAIIMLLAPFISTSGAFLIGAFGCFFADIFLGYGHYAIFTFLIKGIEWIVVASLCKKLKFAKKNFLIYPLAALWMLCGYALTDSFIAQSIQYFPVSFIANLTQGLSCMIIALILSPLVSPVLKKIKW